jgi:peptidylprolyl isomerase
MRNLGIWILLSSSVATWCGCHGDDESAEQPAVTARKARPQGVPQVAPPLDLKAPPADATKTASGLIYKRLNANSAGAQARIDETVLVRYTGWRQHTGETFFTTGSGQPIAIDLAHAAPGFREALPLLHKGEKAVVWLPASPGTAEPLAYEVELVDILSKPVATVEPARPDRTASPTTAPHDSAASASTVVHAPSTTAAAQR